MQEVAEFLNWIFTSVLVFMRRTVKKIQGILYYRKCERVIAEFKASERNDVNCQALPIISFEDYPTIADLNRYLRENFGDRYPEYIEVKQVGYKLILKMIAVGEVFLEHKNGIINLNNGKGKIYTYQEFVLEHAF